MTVYSGFVEPTYRGFAASEVMDLCVTRRGVLALGGGQVERGNGLEDTRNQLFVWKSKALPAFWEVWVVNHQ